MERCGVSTSGVMMVGDSNGLRISFDSPDSFLGFISMKRNGLIRMMYNEIAKEFLKRLFDWRIICTFWAREEGKSDAYPEQDHSEVNSYSLNTESLKFQISCPFTMHNAMHIASSKKAIT